MNVVQNLSGCKEMRRTVQSLYKINKNKGLHTNK